MRLLFVTNNLPIGGIERALLDNVAVLRRMGHEVEILLRDRTGAFLEQLPKEVRVREFPLRPLDRYEASHGRGPTLRHCLTHGHWLFAARMLLYRIVWDLSGRRKNYDYAVIRRAVARAPRFDGAPFDVAIAYFADGPWSAIMTLNWVRAARKISWSHNERNAYRRDPQLHLDYYSRFDGHYACSTATAERINVALGLPGLVKFFPYLIDPAQVEEKGRRETVSYGRPGRLSILTVGRVCEQKSPDGAIRICRRLKEAGTPCTWYWVGGGAEAECDELRRQIAAAGLTEDFVFLGPKQNPYPYFPACDVYAQPSRYEGYCLTVAEARIFNRPIVATDFDGARDQIEDGVTGFIVPEDDEDAFFAALKKLLEDAGLRERFARTQASREKDTARQVEEAWARALEGAL